MHKTKCSAGHLSKRNRIRKKNSFLITAKISKKDSFLYALSSIEAPGSNPRKCKRNSFLIASKILSAGTGNAEFDMPALSDSINASTMSAKNRSGMVSKRDSFLLTMDRLDFPDSDNFEKYDSQLFLSELADLDIFEDLNQKGFHNSRNNHNETFTLPKSKCSRRRSSFLKISGAFDIKHSKERNMKKRTSFVACLDTDFSKPFNQYGTDLHSRKKRRLSAVLINQVSAPKPYYEINMFTEKNFEHESNQVLQSLDQNPSSTLISFCQSMKSSEDSQTLIHNWDKKMGLRRSHSKTMRNSMRSRNQLLKFCSNQIFKSL